MKILNNKNKSKRSVNADKLLKVDLVKSARLLPLDEVVAYLNEELQYQKERENCNTIRLITTINPVCSNVLHNKITEVVKNEGDNNELYCLNYASRWDKDLSFRNSLGTDTNEPSVVIDCIRDTQLSGYKDPSSGLFPYQYHCGSDIFNNHIFRSLTFKTVCAPKTGQTLSTFNTLSDMMRDVNGNTIKGYPNTKLGKRNGDATIKLHLYRGDEVLSFEESVAQNLIEQNGWLGFKNASKMKTYSYSKNETNPSSGNISVSVLPISNVINNKQACEFITMAPEKDLFAFTPKYNKYQNRLEHNWFYQLTYPSSSTTNVPYIRENTNSLKIVYFDDKAQNSNGTEGLKIYSITKHGLNVDDRVNIYNGDEVIIPNSRVLYVEDEFTFVCDKGTTVITDSWIDFSDSEDDYKLSASDLNAHISKITVTSGESNIECDVVDDSRNVYINRDGYKVNVVISGGTITFMLNNQEYTISETTTTITSPIDNVEYNYNVTFPKSNEYTFYILKNGRVNIDITTQDISYKQVILGEEVEYYVRIFSCLPNWKFAQESPTQYNIYKENSNMITDNQIEFENHITNTAFAKNIYGDDITQIVYTDDINIGELKDNLGRPLSEIYVTILKNNAGHKEWYDTNQWNEKGMYNNSNNISNIEYSHVFGKLNCGFNLSPSAIILKDDLKIGHITAMTNVGINALPGLVNNLNAKAQTDEISPKEDKNFYGDLCCLSRVAYAEKTIDNAMFRFNTAQRELGDNAPDAFKTIFYDEITKDDYDAENGYDFVTTYEVPDFKPNELPEGYCYQAHHKIPIKTYSNELESQYPKISRIKNIIKQNDNEDIYTITTKLSNYFENYDVFVLYSNKEDVWFEGQVTKVIDKFNFECKISNKCDDKEKNVKLDVYDNPDDYRILRKDVTIPQYALLTKDGTCRYIWRWLRQNGNDSFSTNEIYPFTNGALYVNKMINFYLKRQDPHNVMRHYNEGMFDIKPVEVSVKNDNTHKTEDEIVC